MGIFKAFLITFLSIVVLALLIPSITFASWPTLVIASIVLTLLQKIVRPVLKILFLPINIITMGLFSGVINVLILWLVMAIVPGFHIQSLIVGGHHLGVFWSLSLVSFALALIETLIDIVI
jgi:putative membrane protein